jgi:hypothetical protein
VDKDDVDSGPALGSETESLFLMVKEQCQCHEHKRACWVLPSGEHYHLTHGDITAWVDLIVCALEAALFEPNLIESFLLACSQSNYRHCSCCAKNRGQNSSAEESTYLTKEYANWRGCQSCALWRH